MTNLIHICTGEFWSCQLVNTNHPQHPPLFIARIFLSLVLPTMVYGFLNPRFSEPYANEKFGGFHTKKSAQSSALSVAPSPFTKLV
jgi:hypothetical protein